MYPSEELIRLDAHKAVLRRRITRHRNQCVHAVIHLSEPVEWLDRLLALWRKISPFAKFAAVPLAFLAQRTLFPRGKLMGNILRWGPIVFGAVRRIGTAVHSRQSSQRNGDRA